MHVFNTTSPSSLSLTPLSTLNQVVPYVGHNRTTYVLPASTYHVLRVRPSVINRDIKHYEHRRQPVINVSPTLHCLNTDPVMVNILDFINR